MPSPDAAIAAVAARNNAEWCDAVCRSHGSPGVFASDAWTNPCRTPRFYPDAVTLQASTRVEDLLARVDATEGCTIKDSFADLDLTTVGFHVLFDAEWISRPQEAPTNGIDSHSWSRVADPETLALWESAWSAGDSSPSLFLPELLADISTVILAEHTSNRITAGGIANLACGVVGVSNIFSRTDATDGTWPGFLAAVARHFPGVPLVGYESGSALATARAHGFTSVGPLRVWINEA